MKDTHDGLDDGPVAPVGPRGASHASAHSWLVSHVIDAPLMLRYCSFTVYVPGAKGVVVLCITHEMSVPSTPSVISAPFSDPMTTRKPAGLPNRPPAMLRKAHAQMWLVDASVMLTLRPGRSMNDVEEKLVEDVTTTYWQLSGPSGPMGPVAPVPPVAPVAPVAPVVPVELVAPVPPVWPVLPVWPVAPVAPVLPVAPVGPVGPVKPVKPVAPVLPVLPVKPVGPVEPVMPVEPVLPV